MDFDSNEFGERVIVNLAMLRIGDKALELEELSKHLAEQTAELRKLMEDWAAALPAPLECHWYQDKLVHTVHCTCDEDLRQDEL